MDWQAAEDGLKSWLAAMTGVEPELIAWDRAPALRRTYPQIDLRFFDHRARDGVSPELIYGEPDEDGMLHPEVSAQRACSWSITVTTRDQRANGKAYVMLDRLAVMLELPYTAAYVEALGLSLLDLGRVIPNTDVARDHRDESQAVLTLQLGYVTTVSVPDGAVPADDVSIIEHVELGGTAIDVTTPIPIDPHIVPPLA